MAGHAVFKGALSFGMLSIAIRAYKATNDKSEGISFRQLHSKCNNPISQKKTCDTCGEKNLGTGDLVKGYEHTKGQFVVFTQEEVDSVRPASTKVIAIDTIVDEGSINPIYYDNTYYLGPESPVAFEAFATMREALRGSIGIGTIGMYGRDYIAAIRPLRQGFEMQTIKHAGEIRVMESTVKDLEKLPTTVKSDQLKLAKSLVGILRGEFDPENYKDTFRDAMLQRIQDKLAGKQTVEADTAPVMPQAANVMAALEASLANLKPKTKKVKKTA